MNTRCIPNFPQPSCPPGAGVAVQAAKAAADSAELASRYAEEAKSAAASSEPPYIGPNKNWWRGDEDLGVSAQGPQGETGPIGETGPVGPPGPTGEPGVSASEFYDGMNTRTTIVNVTQAEKDAVTAEDPTIYLIKNGKDEVEKAYFGKERYIDLSNYQRTENLDEAVETLNYAKVSYVDQKTADVRQGIEGDYGYLRERIAVEDNTINLLGYALTLNGTHVLTESDVARSYDPEGESPTSGKAVAQAVAEAPYITVQRVAVLPDTGVEDVIYVVPSSRPITRNHKEEFFWDGDRWEQLGATPPDLSPYVLQTEFDSTVATINTTTAGLNTRLSAAEGTLADVTSRVTEAEDIITEHTEQLQGHTNTLAEHTAELQEHTNTLQNHTAEIQNHATELQNHATELQNHGNSLENLNSTAENHENRLNSLDTEVENLHNDVAELQNTRLKATETTLHEYIALQEAGTIDNNTFYVVD